jgi:hypothetical protein
MLANLDTVFSPYDKELMVFTREYIGSLKRFETSVEEIHEAFRLSNLTEYYEGKGQEQLLESIGIALIITLQPYGPGPIAITPAASDAEAQRLLSIVSQEEYHLFRKALGIPYHWVLQFDPESPPELDDLMTKSMYWFHDHDENPPECSVLDLQWR